MRNVRFFLAVMLLAAPVARASVDDALDVLHASGVALKSLAAKLKLRTVDGGLGENTTRIGTFVLQKRPDGDTRIRATFTKRQSGKKFFDEHRDYVLAGTDLIERDYEAKPLPKETTRQVRSPGEKLDLFKLGEGPFPLPIGQPREDVLRAFTVEEIKTDDATALTTLKLIPKAGTPLADKFGSITVLIDRATKLPKRIETVDPRNTETQVAELSEVRVNEAVKDEEFKLEPIDPKAWDRVSGK